MVLYFIVGLISLIVSNLKVFDNGNLTKKEIIRLITSFAYFIILFIAFEKAIAEMNIIENKRYEVLEESLKVLLFAFIGGHSDKLIFKFYIWIENKSFLAIFFGSKKRK